MYKKINCKPQFVFTNFICSLKGQFYIWILFLFFSVCATCNSNSSSLRKPRYTTRLTLTAANNSSVFDSVVLNQDSDTGKRVKELSNNKMALVSKSLLSFDVREGLPMPVSFESLSIYEDLNISGSSIFNSSTCSNCRFTASYIGKFAKNSLRYRELRDSANLVQLKQDGRNVLNITTYLYRVHDKDIVIPPILNTPDSRCPSPFCIGTDSLTGNIFSTLRAAITESVNRQHIPFGRKFLLENDFEIYLIPHAQIPKPDLSIVNAYGYVFKAQLDIIVPLTVYHITMYIPVIVMFEKNDAYSIRVSIVPPGGGGFAASNVGLEVSGGPLHEQIADTVRKLISSAIAGFRPAVVQSAPDVDPSVQTTLLFTHLLNKNQADKPIPSNFDVIAVPESSRGNSTLLRNVRNGKVMSFNLRFLENKD